jgi:exo-1,4-beta-D-glucosaminidase
MRWLRPRFRGWLLVALAVACAMPGVASARTRTLGLGGWQVDSSATATQTGADISSPGFSTAGWMPVRPDDAGAPGSEINARLQNGACPQVFVSTRMKDCFGYTDQWTAIGQFAVPWWYRTDFRTPRHGHAEVVVNGIVGAGDVWVNGTKVGSVQGAFTRSAFDVSSLVRRGRNTLAVEVQPNDPNTMFTLDDVDWNQIPPDNHTAIQFPIQLHTSHALALSNAHVLEDNAADLSRSSLTVKGDVTNTTSSAQTGLVTATIVPPGHHRGGALRVAKRVSVPAGATQTVQFDPVTIHHPRVWWPYQLGDQPLYALTMGVSQHGRRSDSAAETFGIRTITTRLVGPAPNAPQGSRRFEVNGRPIVFRGGGFAEDLFLRYSSDYTAQQIGLIKNLGLNGIRLEGHEMPGDFYEQMDRAGILIDAGFQCCDRWQLPRSGRGVTEQDYQVIHDSALAIGKRLRNHPSILNYSWSDNAPIPRQEQVTLQGFHEADFDLPIIASAEYKSTPTLGTSGEKEGPYDWVPPAYWYDTEHFDPDDSSRTNVGGAWAFNSEASAGHTVPTLDSIRRWLSPAEQAALWQQPDFNQYHANYEPDLPNPDENGGYSFGTLHDLDQAITNRYGAWSSLGQYVEQAQAQNYETQRAEFEAYIDHSTNAQAPSTGIVYWQLNKGWPTLLWDLYNQDFDQAGSYFGAKKANEPLHVLYAYDDGTVTVDDLAGQPASGLSVEANVYDLAGNRLDHQVANGLRVDSQGVLRDVLRPDVPSGGAARTYFVQLLLRQGHHVVDRNVYWMSSKPDVVDWDATMGNPQATMTQYADLTQLQHLTSARLAVSAGSRRAGDTTVTKVTIRNTSRTRTVGFLLRADVRRGTSAGTPDAGDNQVLPIAWSDNDVTLWPGESETLTATYRTADLHGRAPVVGVSGWNAPTMTVAAH